MAWAHLEVRWSHDSLLVLGWCYWCYLWIGMGYAPFKLFANAHQAKQSLSAGAMRVAKPTTPQAPRGRSSRIGG